MRTRSEHEIRDKSQRLASLRKQAAELERELAHARVSLEGELARPSREPAPFRAGPAPFRSAPGSAWEPWCSGEWPSVGAGEAWSSEDREPAPADASELWPPGDSGAERPPWAEREDWGEAGAGGGADAPPAGDVPAPGGTAGSSRSSQGNRTERIVWHGRLSAYRPGGSRRRKLALAIAVAALLALVLAVLLPGGGGSWPTSVATVQREAAQACQNPNVTSEPGQVDFACAPRTRQILWVFALMTSGDNPRFADPSTGRLGLEPIAPAQGGALAWSLNLHHPYNPFNPVDSLEVAARAINNIVGGATVPGVNGKPVVEPGLESVPANCARYTGSAALTVRQNFPGMCDRRLTSAGMAALVADIYQRWIVGASPQDARDAAILFQNPKNPGDQRVQAILAHLPVARL